MEGNGPSEFSINMRLEVDASDNIYVSDEGLSRVLKFSESGTFLEQVYSGSGSRAIAFFKNGNYVATRVQSSSYIQIFNSNKKLIREWGTYGTGDNGFGNVETIAIDDEENIWIVDGNNHRIKKYDQYGNLLLISGKRGVGLGEFDAPFGICYFKGNIYVSDTRNRRIQVLNKQGKFIRQYPISGYILGMRSFGDHIFFADSGQSCVIKSNEAGDIQEKIGLNQFKNITDVTVNSKGDVVACDYYGRKIIVFRKG